MQNVFSDKDNHLDPSHRFTLNSTTTKISKTGQFRSGRLNGPSNNVAFLFIHGYGTSPLDLLPLANSFNQSGYTCELITLKGHDDKWRALEIVEVEEWEFQIKDIYSRLLTQFQKVYIVGFSLGAILAIDLATKIQVAGILGISPFFRHRNPISAALLLKLQSWMPKRWSLRKLQTTSKKTLNKLRWAPRLPFGLSIMIAKKAKNVRKRFGELSCPALFLCSIDDKVSDYKTVITTVKNAPNLQTKIVTLKGVNHFLQFDVANETIKDLTLEYFGLRRYKRS